MDSNIENRVEALVLALHTAEVVKFGRFQLSSGVISPIYIDLRLMISHPAVLRQAAAEYARLLEAIQFDVIAAIPYAGLPIGTAIAVQTDYPLIFPRKATKSYGTGQLIEGKWHVGQRAAIIEDLVTSGGSVLKGIAALKASGLQVQDVVVLIDRQQRGKRNLEVEGYKLHAVMTVSEMSDILERNGRITTDEWRAVRGMITG